MVKVLKNARITPGLIQNKIQNFDAQRLERPLELFSKNRDKLLKAPRRCIFRLLFFFLIVFSHFRGSRKIVEVKGFYF